MNILGIVLLSASIFSGSIEPNYTCRTSLAPNQVAIAGPTITIKGTWNKDESLSTANVEVGTCDKTGKCLTIYMDDGGNITDVDLHNGIIISGGNIEVNASDNEYTITY